MKRKIYDELLKWKRKKQGSTALLIEEARRIGKSYTLNSLMKYVAKYEEQLSTPYVLHSNDVKIENDIVYLPLYMTPLL